MVYLISYISCISCISYIMYIVYIMYHTVCRISYTIGVVPTRGACFSSVEGPVEWGAVLAPEGAAGRGVTCITIIDTIILIIHTNDAYISDTHTPLRSRHKELRLSATCAVWLCRM
jgi:hypothetical protein